MEGYFVFVLPYPIRDKRRIHLVNAFFSLHRSCGNCCQEQPVNNTQQIKSCYSCKSTSRFRAKLIPSTLVTIFLLLFFVDLVWLVARSVGAWFTFFILPTKLCNQRKKTNWGLKQWYNLVMLLWVKCLWLGLQDESFHHYLTGIVLNSLEEQHTLHKAHAQL